MRKFDVICSETFLSRFFHDYLSDIQDVEQDVDDIQVLVSWKRLLFSESDLLIDLDYSRWEDLFKSDLMFRMLEKASQSGGSRIQCLLGIIDSVKNGEMINDFPSLLCLTDLETKEFLFKHGRLFISLPEIKVIGKQLFKESIFMVSKKPDTINSLKSWKELNYKTIPLTDLVIIDNYILNNEGLENLIEIIKNIIPTDQNKGTIRLSIVTALFNETLDKIQEKGSLWHKNIVGHLKQEVENFVFNVSLGIFSNKSLNHDRSLITNYIWIDSAQGFNCFNIKGLPKVKTTIKYSPIFSPAGNHKSSVSPFDCWLEIRSHAKSLIKCCDFTIGSFSDNLLLR